MMIISSGPFKIDNVVTISGCTFINDTPGGATFFYNNAGATATIQDTQIYAAAGATPITMTLGTATVTGTTTLSSRPVMDDAHPWESLANAAGVGAAIGISGNAPSGVSMISTSTMAYGQGRTTHSFAKPLGATNGNRLIAAIFAGKAGSSQPTITAPAGWTAIGTNPHCAFVDPTPYSGAFLYYYRDLTASEPDIYSWTGSADSEGLMWCLSGVDPAIAPKVSTDNTGIGNTISNSVTVATNLAWAAHVAYCWETAFNSTPPANYTERYEGTIVYAADRSAPTGATGTTTATNAGNAGQPFGASKIVVETTATVGGGVITERAGIANGVGAALAVGQTVKNAVGTAAGVGVATAGVAGQAEGVAFGFGTALGFSAASSDATGTAAGRGSATAFAASPGHASRGIAPIEAPDHRPIIGFGNWADVAIYSDGSWRDKLPLKNLGTQEMGQLARTVSTDLEATKFTVDIGRGRAVRVLGLLNHNIRFAGRYRLTASSSPIFDSIAIDTGWLRVWPPVYPMNAVPWGADNFWSRSYSEDEIDGYPWHLVILLKGSTFLRYWRLEIDDVGNPAGYIQAGRLFIGDAWQPENGVPYGANMDWEDPTTLISALSGAKYPDPKPPYRVARITSQMMSTDEAYSKAFEILRRSGNWKDTLYIHDPTDTVHAIRRRFPARIRGHGATTQPYPDAHETSWEFEEQLP